MSIDSITALKVFCTTVFDEFDTDKSGTMDAKELHYALTLIAESQGWDNAPTEKQVAKVLKKMPTKTKNVLNLEEFISFVQAMKVEIMCMFLFDTVDKDKNGFITADELKIVVTRIYDENGLFPPNDVDVEKMAKEIGGDDGKIDFVEFCLYIIPLLD